VSIKKKVELKDSDELLGWVRNKVLGRGGTHSESGGGKSTLLFY